MTVEIDQLSVELGGTDVLDSVSLRVEKGSWLGIVGPNGAGKTTLLRAIAGLVTYRGEITVSGRSLLGATRRQAARLVAYVPQRPVLPAAMTVTDYILLGRTAHHSYFSAETRRDRRVVAKVLERLELTSLAQRPLGQVSGGEAQRAVLGRALAQEAPVLVMDEPTASLDLGHGQLVLELADELRQEHALTVICAMHDLTIAAQYADFLVALCRGQVVRSGHVAEVLTGANVAQIFSASVEIIEGRDGIVVAPVRPRHSWREEIPTEQVGLTRSSR